MSSNTTKIVATSALAGFTVGALSLWGIMHWYQRRDEPKCVERIVTIEKPTEILHWNPLEERRGIGDLVVKTNHIAIVVSDVGRSLNFYVDILGLQQIRRPNFDRHGAWLTMGNIELHLIKGVPVPPSNDNLVVGHIALETKDMNLVLQKLREFNIEFRHNISVPDPTKSRENKFEGLEAKQETQVIQYFFRDPDGYYIELCNCDILTAFCHNKEKQDASFEYHEGVLKCRALNVIQTELQWQRKVLKKRKENLDVILENTPRASQLNEERFQNLCKRRYTYGDVMQSFSDTEIEEALLQADNLVPLAVKILTRKRGSERIYQPSSFYENETLIKPKIIRMNS